MYRSWNVHVSLHVAPLVLQVIRALWVHCSFICNEVYSHRMKAWIAMIWMSQVYTKSWHDKHYGMKGIPVMTGMPVITGIPASGTSSSCIMHTLILILPSYQSREQFTLRGRGWGDMTNCAMHA